MAEGEGYAYQKAVLTAFKEVNNALVSCRKIEEIRQARMNLEEAARSYLDLANLQYINGVIGYLDVLDAQRGFFDAQIGLNNAVRDELIAVVNLYKVLGGGWEADTLLLIFFMIVAIGILLSKMYFCKTKGDENG